MPDPANEASATIRLALLHAGLLPDDLDNNLTVLQKMSLQALDTVPDLIVMPELAFSGYEFQKYIGIDWIPERTPRVLDWFSAFARDNHVSVVLTTPWHDPKQDILHNAALVIDTRGEVAGKHNKINALSGSEGWSQKGTTADPIPWNGIQLGVLICSDMYTKTIVSRIVEQGAQLLVSPANWAPGFHGPSGEWEERSQEYNVTVVVCNRTGKEDTMDFRGSASVVAARGKRLMEYAEVEPAILSVELALSDWLPTHDNFAILPYQP